MKPPNYLFCPFCGKKLLIKKEEIYERKYCSTCNWTYYPQVFTSVAAVIYKNDKLLMVKRGRQPHINTWMFPGGFVEYGENPKITLKREVEEETGLKFIKADFIDIVDNKDDYRAPGNLIMFFKVKTSGNKVKTDLKENLDIAWFDYQKPPKIGFKSHLSIFNLLCKK